MINEYFSKLLDTPLISELKNQQGGNYSKDVVALVCM